MDDLDILLAGQGKVASAAQLMSLLGRAAFDTAVARGELVQVRFGVYARSAPSPLLRLSGLDLRAGKPVAVCLGTAAAAYGFDTENTTDLHVLSPPGHQLRRSTGLVVHRREGAPLVMVRDRAATEPAWTAVEVARGLRRPRALATLDAALRSGTCDRRGLLSAAARQAGRRGIVQVRELIPLARHLSESPMESEARLAMHDGGLPEPVLQLKIIDRNGRVWRVDFAWPDRLVAVEYEGYDWHSSPASFARDQQKRAALQEIGWSVVSIIADDVRRHAPDMVRRIDVQLSRPLAA